MGREEVAHHQPSFLGDAGKELRLRSGARMGVKVCAHNPDIAYVMKQQIATISAIWRASSLRIAQTPGPGGAGANGRSPEISGATANGWL
jgi:hypothetical protein